MEITELTQNDFSDVLDLSRELELDVPLTMQWLRFYTVEDPTCSPDLLLVARHDQGVVGFCFACIREQGLVIKAFAVAPSYRHQGIATQLFDAIEERGRKHGCERALIGGVGPNYFAPGIDLTLTPAISFVMHRGYETDRRALVDMKVDPFQVDLDISDTRRRLEAQGIELRRAFPEEVERVSVFAKHFSEAWRQETLAAVGRDPLPLFVALDGEEIIAFAVHDVTGHAKFGPTGTHPDYRRRGIGGALLKMCLQDNRARGDRLVCISWAGPVAYYARAVDARIYRAYWAFQKALD